MPPSTAEGIQDERDESSYDFSRNMIWVKRSNRKNQPLEEMIMENVLLPGKNKILLKKVISIINGAEEVLCIASFLIKEQVVKDAILEATKRGVRVYILTVAENDALKDADEENEDSGSVKAHIEFVKALNGKALVRTGQNFHAKYILADPNDIHKANGLLFTGNLTGSLILSADIALILNPEQIHGLYHQFLIGFWKMATGELTDDGYNPLPQSKDSPVEIQAYEATRSVDFNAGDYYSGIGKRLISFIQETDGHITAFAWNFDFSNYVVYELCKAVNNGDRSLDMVVNVPRYVNEIKLNNKNRESSFDPTALERLFKKKAKIYGYNRFHAKGLISSQNGRTRAIVMTANYDVHSIEHGFNSLIEVDANQAVKIKEVVDHWKTKAEYILAWNDG